MAKTVTDHEALGPLWVAGKDDGPAEKVLAKYQHPSKSVERKDMQAFFDALKHRNARKEFFITTGLFSSDRMNLGCCGKGTVLTDSDKLASRMIDYYGGVEPRHNIETVRIGHDLSEGG